MKTKRECARNTFSFVIYNHTSNKFDVIKAIKKGDSKRASFYLIYQLKITKQIEGTQP